jgi:hypothetical protein
MQAAVSLKADGWAIRGWLRPDSAQADWGRKVAWELRYVRDFLGYTDRMHKSLRDQSTRTNDMIQDPPAPLIHSIFEEAVHQSVDKASSCRSGVSVA